MWLQDGKVETSLVQCAWSGLRGLCRIGSESGEGVNGGGGKGSRREGQRETARRGWLGCSSLLLTSDRLKLDDCVGEDGRQE